MIDSWILYVPCDNPRPLLARVNNILVDEDVVFYDLYHAGAYYWATADEVFFYSCCSCVYNKRRFKRINRCRDYFSYVHGPYSVHEQQMSIEAHNCKHSEKPYDKTMPSYPQLTLLRTNNGMPILTYIFYHARAYMHAVSLQDITCKLLGLLRLICIRKKIQIQIRRIRNAVEKVFKNVLGRGK